MVCWRATGDVRYHKNFYSPKLDNERDLIVWLPPGYDEKRRRRYAVLYAHDGQNLFDPRTASAGADWAVGKTADSLIRAGKMRPVIIVGIAHTQDRVNEYTRAKGRDYAAFLIEEVKPFIDGNYLTLPNPSSTAVIGSSLGGLVSFYLAWEHPEVFGMAACLSGSWNWDNAAVFQLVENQSAPIPNIKLYVDHGSQGEEGQNSWMHRLLRDALIRRGFVLGKNLAYNFGVGDNHHETAWARRVWKPLLFFFGR